MIKYLPLLALAACGGGSTADDPSSFAAAADGVAGIYSVDSLTRNEGTCSPGGESILQQDTFAVAFRERFFGIELLTVLSCASPQDCRDKAADRNGFAFEFSFTVEDLEEDGSFSGGGGSTGFGIDGICTEGSVFATTLVLDGTQLRVEKAITIADDYPADDEGFCTTDLAREAAEGNQCSVLEALTATFVEEL